MAKSRPLLASADRYLSFPQEESAARGALLLADLDAVSPGLARTFPLWCTYAKRLPAPLVLERRLMRASANGDERMRRLPAVRLRREHLLGDALVTLSPRHVARVLGTTGPGLSRVVHECLWPLLGGWEEALAATTSPEYVETWQSFILLQCADKTQAWAGLPPSWHEVARSSSGAHLLRTALWRIAAAQWIGACLLPSYVGAWRGAPYQAQLFIDTHLAFLAAVYTHGRLDDAFYLSDDDDDDAKWSAIYPLPHRVCCAEELPDLTPYLIQADLAFDSGRGKKQRTQLQAIIHIFLCKMMNNICHKRHLHSAIEASTRTFPVVRDLFALVVRAMLLGNTPDATSRLALAARIRVQIEFVRDPLQPQATQPADTTGERMVAWATQRKYLSHFLLREFFVYTVQADGVVDRHLGRRREWREYKAVVRYANQQARDEVSRQCIADMARERIEWALLDPHDKRELHEVYVRLGCPAGVATSASRNAHALALSACQKISKGRVEHLLPKKMVPNEMAILKHHADRLLTAPHRHGRIYRYARRAHEHVLLLEWFSAPKKAEWKKTLFSRLGDTIMGRIIGLMETPPAFPSTYDIDPDLERRIQANLQLEGDQRAHQLPTVDVIRRHVVENEVLPPIQRDMEELARVFHVAAWAAARDLNEALREHVTVGGGGRSPVVRLRYLAWLGFTPRQMAAVRQWVYQYSICDVADNQFKRQTCAFGCADLAAFLKLKHYFRLVDKYRDEDRIMVLSAEMTTDTINVLRQRLHLAPHEATPSLAGKALFCAGCSHWATPVKPAPIWIECRNDQRLLAGRIQRLEQQQTDSVGRAWRLDEYLHAPLELGAWEGWTGLDGEAYCRYGRYTKEVLTAQRERARQVKQRMAAEDSSDDDDDDEHAPPVESEAYQADRMYLELIEPTAGRFDTANIRLPNRFGRNRAAAAAAAVEEQAEEEVPSQKKKNSATRAETTRILRRVMQPVFRPLPRFQCRHDAMLTIDLVGIWFSYAGGDLYGLCVYCGDLTTVRNEKMMTRGLSCMNHPHAGAHPPDHPQTLATLPLAPHVAASRARDARTSSLLTARAQRQMQKQASPVMDLRERIAARHPLVLDGIRPCMYCQQFLTRSVIRVVDALLQTAEVALCDACLAALRSFGPTQTIGYRGARAAEPLALDVVLRELERIAGQRRRRRLRAAQAQDAAVDDGVDHAFLARIMASSPERVARLVRNHPGLGTLLANDPDANADYYLRAGGAAVPAVQRDDQLAALRGIAEKLARQQTLDSDALDSL